MTQLKMTSPSRVALFGATSPIAQQISQQSKWRIDTYTRDDCDVLNPDHFDRLFLDKYDCLLYTSPSPRDLARSRMPSSA